MKTSYSYLEFDKAIMSFLEYNLQLEIETFKC